MVTAGGESAIADFPPQRQARLASGSPRPVRSLRSQTSRPRTRVRSLRSQTSKAALPSPRSQTPASNSGVCVPTGETEKRQSRRGAVSRRSLNTRVLPQGRVQCGARRRLDYRLPKHLGGTLPSVVTTGEESALADFPPKRQARPAFGSLRPVCSLRLQTSCPRPVVRSLRSQTSRPRPESAIADSRRQARLLQGAHRLPSSTRVEAPPRHGRTRGSASRGVTKRWVPTGETEKRQSRRSAVWWQVPRHQGPTPMPRPLRSTQEPRLQDAELVGSPPFALGAAGSTPHSTPGCRIGRLAAASL